MIEFVKHNSIKIKGSKTIYIDPYKIEEEYKDADYIFSTHSHYDHFSEEDIKKIIKPETKIIVVESSKEETLKLTENVYVVEPEKEYEIDELSFCTKYAYNVDKQFHPRENNWVGFIINLDGEKYYIAGDTDNIPELQDVECDVAFLPVGGTYTMNYEEAANLANVIKAKTVVPTHYGVLVGKEEDAIKFKELVKSKNVEIIK